MKSKIFLKVVSSVFCVFLVLSFVIPASASGETSTSLYQSTEGTSAQWHTEPVKYLTSPDLTNICGGDMGMWFYAPSVGLQDSFVKSNNRKAYFECYEYDKTTGNADMARKYTASFGTASNGICAPASFSGTYVNTNIVESDSGLELYMRYKVNKVSGDTSTTVKAGIIKYCYWVY